MIDTMRDLQFVQLNIWKKRKFKSTKESMEIIRFECPKRCHLYSKSFEEIIEAGNKHRENVLALKDISEKQKVKLSSLREEKNVLLDKVDGLEHDKRKDCILRVVKRYNSKCTVI